MFPFFFSCRDHVKVSVPEKNWGTMPNLYNQIRFPFNLADSLSTYTVLIEMFNETVYARLCVTWRINGGNSNQIAGKFIETFDNDEVQ